LLRVLTRLKFNCNQLQLDYRDEFQSSEGNTWESPNTETCNKFQKHKIAVLPLGKSTRSSEQYKTLAE
jgi:hypothetical protein